MRAPVSPQPRSLATPAQCTRPDRKGDVRQPHLVLCAFSARPRGAYHLRTASLSISHAHRHDTAPPRTRLRRAPRAAGVRVREGNNPPPPRSGGRVGLSSHTAEERPASMTAAWWRGVFGGSDDRRRIDVRWRADLDILGSRNRYDVSYQDWVSQQLRVLTVKPTGRAFARVRTARLVRSGGGVRGGGTRLCAALPPSLVVRSLSLSRFLRVCRRSGTTMKRQTNNANALSRANARGGRLLADGAGDDGGVPRARLHGLLRNCP